MGFFTWRFFVTCFVGVIAFLIYKSIEIPNAEIEGFVSEGFEDLRIAYRELFAPLKLEKGSSFAAYHNGKLVAHLWAGCKNVLCTDMWQENTTSLMHSTTKVLGALCLAVMADRGRFSYSDKVSKHWPEFASNGKESITIDDLLAHQAGVVGVSPPLTFEELKNDDPIVGQRLAEQKPAWKPGTEAHYHGLTIGMYMNELFKRVHPDRRSCVDFLENDIFSPLKLDIKIGLRDRSQMSRYAHAHVFSNLRLLMRPYFRNETVAYEVLNKFFINPNNTYKKIMSPIAGTYIGHDFFRTSYLSIPLLSTTGVSTSKSLAHLMGIVALGGQGSTASTKFPHTLIQSPNIMRKLLQPVAQINSMTLLENFYLGSGLSIIMSPSGSKMIGFPGMGGQMGYADPEKKLGFAYLSNHMSIYNGGDDPRHLHLQRALYKIIDNIQCKKGS